MAGEDHRERPSAGGGVGGGGSLVEKGPLEGEEGDLPGEGAWSRS